MNTAVKRLTMTAMASAVAMPAMAADVVIGVPNWPSVLATAHVIKVALEENLGLEVENLCTSFAQFIGIFLQCHDFFRHGVGGSCVALVEFRNQV